MLRPGGLSRNGGEIGNGAIDKDTRKIMALDGWDECPRTA